jgi:hypothetical protein
MEDTSCNKWIFPVWWHANLFVDLPHIVSAENLTRSEELFEMLPMACIAVVTSMLNDKRC